MKQNSLINFILALHNHQPVGNLDDVFLNSFERTYDPFIKVLEKHPEMRCVLHYSGSLLDWLMINEPGFIDRLRALIKDGRVEIMGGGYYEPILPVIPDEDRIGQIKLMSSVLEEQFAVRPRGLWLAERVWEPHLPSSLSRACMEYVTVDDAHFYDAGYEDLSHYFRTEDEGHSIDIFPISEELRYLIPFKPPQETINFLNERRSDAGPCLFVLADDGEKFGGWPGTYESVYDQGWLEEFFNLLEGNRDWLEVTTFSDYRSIYPPRGPVYLPTSSYREMKEWSGGFWRNFFSRYPESNRMHKKMLAVRRQLDKLPQGEQRERAQRHIWAGQCNCAYWHGVFGGLYLNFLRSAVWKNLLQAEKIIADTLQEPPYIEISSEDRTHDGYDEIVLDTDRWSLLLAPQLGGSMWELSWRPGAANLLDTITRKPEAYHKEYIELAARPKTEEQGTDSIHNLRAVKEEGILEHLRYDKYPRGCFIEHFIEKRVTLDEFTRGEYHELGSFFLQPAESNIERISGKGDSDKDVEGARITFHRKGNLGDGLSVRLEKRLLIYSGEDRFQVEYSLTNCSQEEKEVSFAVEQNLAFLGGGQGQFYEIPGRDIQENSLDSTGSEAGVESISMYDNRRNLQLNLLFDRPALVWRAPIETVSLSEEGLERSYQQSLILSRWDLTLFPGKEEKVRLSVEVAALEQRGQKNPGAGKEVQV